MTRRSLMTLLAAHVAAGVFPPLALAQRPMPARIIATSGELLPIVGFGSTRPVSRIAELGPERVAAIIRTLVQHGGRVVDTWPVDASNDAELGRIISQADIRDRLFATINLVQRERQEAIDHFSRTLRLYDRDAIDLVNVGNLTSIETHWPALRGWKDMGLARYIGVTVASSALYDALESFLAGNTPDFVMINYSVTEREAERRLLPLLADRGIAVLISRPFMDGAYFERLEGRRIPEWMVELECETWAQFSLQYILANRAVTCVLTETTDPAHMAENALTAFKPLPEERIQQRMRQLIDEL